jgi:hypothetical protein
MGLIGCPETPLNNYQSVPRNIPEKQKSYLCHSGILKSHKMVGKEITFPQKHIAIIVNYLRILFTC